MRIKKYIDFATNAIDEPFNENENEIIITRIQNEQFDQVELNTLTNERDVLSMFDRFQLDNESFFQWYISSSSKKLDNPNKTLLGNRIYRHNILLTELAEKLKNYQVSNLSFNNFLDQSFILLNNQAIDGDIPDTSNWETNDGLNVPLIKTEEGLNTFSTNSFTATPNARFLIDTGELASSVGDKIFVYTKIRTNSDMDIVDVYLENLSTGDEHFVGGEVNPGDNEYTICKTITLTGAVLPGSGFKIRYNHEYTDAATANNKILTVFNDPGIFLINLRQDGATNLSEAKLKGYVEDGFFEGNKKFFVTPQLFPTEFEIIERVRLLTPFEQDFNIKNTRVWFGTETTRADTSSGDPIWKQKGYTERLYNILIAKNTVKETETADRNLYEFLQDRFIDLGGTPRLIATEWSDSVLDIYLFNEEVGNVTIDNFLDYRETKNINNYANNAEIVTNNIINVDSPYHSGVGASRVLQTEDYVFDEELAEANLEMPIYNMIEVVVSPIESNDYTDLTRYFVDSEKWATYDVTRGSAEDLTTQNSIPYTRGSSVIKDFGKQTVKEGIIRQTNTRWANMFEDANVKESTLGVDLQNYKFKFKYDALLINNRFNVKQYNFNQDNKRSNLRINTGEKVNEYDKIVRLAQNRLSRVGARTVEKVVKHFNLDDVYELNSFDTDTGLYIVASETKITKGDIETTYLLTEDLNILTENVGVNSQLRFTDVQIGSSFNRNETYEDWVIFGDVADLQDLDNTSALTTRGINIYIDLFTTNQINSTYSYMVGNGNYIAEDENGNPISVSTQEFLANPIISAGNRTLSFKLPLESQTFVDYEITTALIDEGSGNVTRYVERGVPYTDEFGLLDTLALKYGVNVADSTDEDTVRSYPRKDLFDINDLVTNDNDPYWEIGQVEIEETFNNVGLSPNSITETINFSLIPLLKQTVTLDTPYDITNTTIDSLKFDWEVTGDLFTPNNAKAVIYYTNRYGQEIKRDTIFQDDVFNYFKDGPVTETVNFNGLFITDIRINIEAECDRFLQNYEVTIDLTNVVLTELSVTPNTTQFGLKVIKAPNEILNIEYMNHLHVISSNYILGESLTFKNQFLNLESVQSTSNIFNGWESIEVWTYTGKYNNYNTNVKGTKTTHSVTVANVTGYDPKTDTTTTTGFDLQVRDTENNLVDLTNTFAIVGVFNNENFLLVARNNLSGESINTIRVLFKHFHPLEVINH